MNSGDSHKYFPLPKSFHFGNCGRCSSACGTRALDAVGLIADSTDEDPHDSWYFGHLAGWL